MLPESLLKKWSLLNLAEEELAGVVLHKGHELLEDVIEVFVVAYDDIAVIHDEIVVLITDAEIEVPDSSLELPVDVPGLGYCIPRCLEFWLSWNKQKWRV
jgi:hypothetical protein